MAELLGFSLDSVSCLCGIYLLLHFHSCVGLTGVHFRLSPSVIYALQRYIFLKYIIYVHDMKNDMIKTKLLDRTLLFSNIHSLCLLKHEELFIQQGARAHFPRIHCWAHKFYNFTPCLCINVLIKILRQNFIVMVNTKNRELETL